MAERVFFSEISSMFLYIVCSVLLWYGLMLLHLLLIFFCLAPSDFFFLISLSYDSCFSLLYFTSLFHELQNILRPALLFRFLFDCWYVLHFCFYDRYSKLYPLLVDFLNIFLEGPGWILIEPSRLNIFRCILVFLSVGWNLTASGT